MKKLSNVPYYSYTVHVFRTCNSKSAPALPPSDLKSFACKYMQFNAICMRQVHSTSVHNLVKSFIKWEKFGLRATCKIAIVLIRAIALNQNPLT